MPLTILPQPVPLTQNEHGDIRVTGTRIGLEHIVEDYDDGASAEEIALRYSTLKLVDVYAVIGYYLNNKAEVDVYIEDQYRRANETRKRLGLDASAEDFKKILLERQTRRQLVK
jgi:uncharacterized protein (DUF433 family)